MKHIVTLLAAAFIAGTAFAAPQPPAVKAKAELEVYKELLSLTAEQAAAIEKGLTDKITVGQEAWQIKKDGDAEKAQEMNKAAGKDFYNVLKTTLTKEQMEQYKEKKDMIKDRIKDLR